MNQTTTAYGFGSTINMPVEQAIERVTAALKEEGFGVLTTIDVQHTLKHKLDDRCSALRHSRRVQSTTGAPGAGSRS